MRKAMLLLVIFGLVGTLWAADPFVGTWKSNVEKSKITPALHPPPKSFTIKVVPEGEGFKWIVDIVPPNNGNTLHMVWSGKYDGKDYPAMGDQGADTYAYKKIDSNTLLEVDKKAGKEVSNWRHVVSKDGKMLTQTGKVKDEKGQDIYVTGVFDKQ
jgi:hypothetical protein